MGIDEFRGAHTGPAALLGCGESVGELDLEAIGREMPVIGINESWRALRTPWRVCVDLELQTFHPDELVFHPIAAKMPLRWDAVARIVPNPVPITHLPRVGEPEFFGFRLNEGTHAPSAGYLALEVAAWCGYNPIVLLGFDCAGGYFFDAEKRTPGEAKTHAAWRRWLDAAKAELAAAGVRVEHRP